MKCPSCGKVKESASDSTLCYRCYRIKRHVFDYIKIRAHTHAKLLSTNPDSRNKKITVTYTGEWPLRDRVPITEDVFKSFGLHLDFIQE